MRQDKFVMYVFFLNESYYYYYTPNQHVHACDYNMISINDHLFFDHLSPFNSSDCKKNYLSIMYNVEINVSIFRIVNQTVNFGKTQ